MNECTEQLKFSSQHRASERSAEQSCTCRLAVVRFLTLKISHAPSDACCYAVIVTSMRMPRMNPFAPIEMDQPLAERTGRRRRIAIVVGACLVTAVLAHLFLSSDAANRYYFTCAICRLNRVEYTSTLTGFTHTTSNETSCSKWYRVNVEPNHSHMWIRSSTTGFINYYGETIGIADHDERPGRVIWRLSPDQQIELYRHFDDPMQAKSLFTNLAQPESMVDRGDFSILHSLRQWTDSGFQGQWCPPTASSQ